MDGKTLFKLAPLGALIHFSDGTKRPPAAHVKKVRAWEDRNGTGYFMGVDPADGIHEWSNDRFSLRLHTSDHFIANRSCRADLPMNYEVTPPAPWTILAYSLRGDKDERIEIEHIWADEREARAWFQRNRYEPHKYGRKHMIVNETGKLIPFQFEEERNAA